MMTPREKADLDRWLLRGPPEDDEEPCDYCGGIDCACEEDAALEAADAALERLKENET
jgi:hypothetical protein